MSVRLGPCHVYLSTARRNDIRCFLCLVDIFNLLLPSVLHTLTPLSSFVTLVYLPVVLAIANAPRLSTRWLLPPHTLLTPSNPLLFPLSTFNPIVPSFLFYILTFRISYIGTLATSSPFLNFVYFEASLFSARCTSS